MARQVAAVVSFAAVGGFLFGYDTGVIGGAILLIQEQFHLSSLAVETIISIALVGKPAQQRLPRLSGLNRTPNAGAILGSSTGGALSDAFGRRKGGVPCSPLVNQSETSRCGDSHGKCLRPLHDRVARDGIRSECGGSDRRPICGGPGDRRCRYCVAHLFSWSVPPVSP